MARQRSQRTRDKTEFNKMCTQTKKLIRPTKDKSFNEFVHALDTTKSANYSLYKVTKATLSPKNLYIPPWELTQLFEPTKKKKASKFAHLLAAVFLPNDIASNLVPDIQLSEGSRIKLFSPGRLRNVISKEMLPNEAPRQPMERISILLPTYT